MSQRYTVTRPTAEQCTARERVKAFDGSELVPAFATWYPQMGGYGAFCVVVPQDGCFECYVWHDGEFPFDADAGPPAALHHCEAHQFATFAEDVEKFQQAAKDNPHGLLVDVFRSDTPIPPDQIVGTLILPPRGQ